MQAPRLTVLAWVFGVIAISNVRVTQPCPPDLVRHYNKDDPDLSHCCKLLICLPGTQAHICQKGKPYTTECVPCWPRFYSSHETESSSNTRCKPHTQCTNGSIQVRAGNSTHDTNCQCDRTRGFFKPGPGLQCEYRRELTCKEGYEYDLDSDECKPCPDGTYRNNTDDSKCHAYTICGPGLNITFPGNTTHNRECLGLPSAEPSLPGESGGLSMVVIILIVVIVVLATALGMVLLVCIVKRRRPQEQKQQEVYCAKCNKIIHNEGEQDINDKNTYMENGAVKGEQIHKATVAPLLKGKWARQLSSASMDSGNESDGSVEVSNHHGNNGQTFCDACRNQPDDLEEDGPGNTNDGGGDATERKQPVPVTDEKIDLQVDGAPPSLETKRQHGELKLDIIKASSLSAARQQLKGDTNAHCPKQDDSNEKDVTVTVEDDSDDDRREKDERGSKRESGFVSPGVHMGKVPSTCSTPQTPVVVNLYGHNNNVQIGPNNTQIITEQTSRMTQV